MQQSRQISSQATGHGQTARGRGWNKRRRSDADVATPRWQQAANRSAAARTGRRQWWRRFRLLTLTVFFLGLTALLVYCVVFMPVRTPVIFVVTDYEWPLPPNAFAQEDMDALRNDLGSQTLMVIDDSSEWSSKQRGLGQLDRQLKRFSRRPPRSGTLVLYLSMHGVVDRAGRPCLIPDGASPLASETWLPLSELLARIKQTQLPNELKLLLILDCNRQQVNWNVGLLHNSFADGIPAVVPEAGIKNLVVLNSTSPGEKGWASSGLRGSVFGHYVRMGLAGAADQPENGGDGNHRVSHLELHGYLQRRVDAWARHHRADRQTPMLCPENARDFDVAWSLNRHSLHRVLARSRDVQPGEAPLKPSDLSQLWKRHDALLTHKPHRYDPLVWRDLEHRLLWLEQAVEGGQAYQDAARQTFEDLDRRFTDIEKRAGNAAGSRSVFAHANVFSDEAVHAPIEPRMHSVAMAEYIGPLDATAADSIRAGLSKPRGLVTENGDSDFDTSDQPSGLVGFSEVHLLRVLDQQEVRRRWQDTGVVEAALKIREHAEKLAVPQDARRMPADVRAHAWGRPLLNAADEIRRNAEDRLFAGDTGGLAPDKLFADVERPYDTSELAVATIAAAFSARDRAWAEMPYLGQYLTRPLPMGTDPAILDRQIAERLLTLIEQTNRLDEQIGREAATVEDLAAIADSCAQNTKAVNDLLTELRVFVNEQCRELVDHSDADAETLRSLEAGLEIPLVPWQLRAQVRKKRAEISAELSREFNSPEELIAESGSTVDSGSPAEKEGVAVGEDARYTTYVERIFGPWSVHPALAMADASRSVAQAAAEQPESAKDELNRDAAELSTQGQLLRELLSAVAPGSAQQGTSPPDSDTSRDHLVQADRRVRKLASFWFPDPAEDPIHRLRSRHLQELLIWHGRRSLDGFWGPATTNDKAFFSVATQDYLSAAESLAQPDPSVRKEVDQLTSLLARRSGAARDGLATTAADLLMIDAQQPVSTRVVVRANESAANELPQGHATVFLRDFRGLIPGTLHTLSLPLATGTDGARSHELDVSIDGSVLSGRGPMLEAVTFFRGQEFAAPLLLRIPQGITVDSRRLPYGPAQITLGGLRRKRASMVFILDCSNSMKELMEVEAPTGDRGASLVPRLEVAKDALRSMLARLAERGDARVGVRFYGHRVGWSTEQANTLLRQQEYDLPIPADLRPYEDVELVLPLGRFDSVTAGQVSQRMTSVKPWGESPLYLALARAIRDFDDDDRDTEKSVVVITDGVNYQFNAPAQLGLQREDVEVAYNGQSVSIHIVGFGISAEEGEIARSEFESLAARTEGSYVSATSAPALIKSLERLLSKSEYRVVNDSGKEVGRAQIGSTIAVEVEPDSRLSVAVEIESLREEMELSGGEALQLAISRDGRRIVAPPYDKGNPRFGRLVSGMPRKPSGYRVGVHRPLWTDEGLLFPISFQREDGRVTGRPAEVWIEVTPKMPLENEPHAAYTFYDSNYEPGEPVPLLRLVARDWPKPARQAEVRVWCKSEATDPTEVVPLEQVANMPPPSGDGFPIAALPGITYQARTFGDRKSGVPYQVRLVERHATDVPISALKVQMAPPAQRVVHQSDADNRIVLHTFYFERTPQESPSSAQPAIQFTDRRTLHADAWHLEQAIAVPVADSGDVIVVPNNSDVDTLPSRTR